MTNLCAWRTVVAEAAAGLDGLLLGDGDDADWDGVELKMKC